MHTPNKNTHIKLISFNHLFCCALAYKVFLMQNMVSNLFFSPSFCCCSRYSPKADHHHVSHYTMNAVKCRPFGKMETCVSCHYFIVHHTDNSFTSR